MVRCAHWLLAAWLLALSVTSARPIEATADSPLLKDGLDGVHTRGLQQAGSSSATAPGFEVIGCQAINN